MAKVLKVKNNQCLIELDKKTSLEQGQIVNITVHKYDELLQFLRFIWVIITYTYEQVRVERNLSMSVEKFKNISFLHAGIVEQDLVKMPSELLSNPKNLKINGWEVIEAEIPKSLEIKKNTKESYTWIADTWIQFSEDYWGCDMQDFKNQY